LVDLLVKDIMYLEEEVVKTRYSLSTHLKPPYDKLLREDILSNLSGQYNDSPAYQTYIMMLYNSQDPMESGGRVRHMNNLACGHYGSGQ
jgi:hypothetical protein